MTPVRKSPWRKADARMPKDVRGALTALTVSLLFIVVAGYGAGRVAGGLGPDEGGAALPAAALLCAFLTFRWLGRRRERAIAERLGDEGGEAAVIARYLVGQGWTTARLGQDEGMLSLVDGWLHFRGLETEWSLSADRSTRRGAYVGVTTPLPGVYGHVQLLAANDPSRGWASAVRSLLDAWEAAPVPEGAAVDPPVVARKWWEPFAEPEAGTLWLGFITNGSLFVLATFVRPEMWIGLAIGLAIWIGVLVVRLRRRLLLVLSLSPSEAREARALSG